MESTLVWVLGFLILFIGCWMQTSLGFGLAVIAAPILMIIAPDWVPYVLTSTALVLSVLNLVEQYRDVQIKSMAAAIVGRIPGTIIGAWLLLNISLFWLHLSVTVCVLIAVLVSLMTIHFTSTPSRMGVAGFISGVIGTTTSIGGPPIALVMQHEKSRHVRANLSAYFTYSTLLSLISYVIAGLMTWDLFVVCMIFSPCAVIGFFVGRHTQAWVGDKKRFRPLLLGMCSVSALVAFAGLIFH